LGLDQKGHLGPGADGDVTIYSNDSDIRRMFSMPRYVITAGEIIVDDGEVRGNHFGKTLFVSPPFDEGVLPDIQQWFEANYTLQFANYPVSMRYLPHPHQVEFK